MNVIEPSISDEAVRAKTGMDWGEWFAILDAAGAQNMTHKQIVVFLADNYAVGAWWQQMVTVTYEQARGLREKHEMPEGYQISRSRTLAAPLDRVYSAWADASQRARWLPEAEFTVRKATPDKGLRATWIDGESALDLRLTAKGDQKTQVTVQHYRLQSAEQGEEMKRYWSEALDKLEEFVHTAI